MDRIFKATQLTEDVLMALKLTIADFNFKSCPVLRKTVLKERISRIEELVKAIETDKLDVRLSSRDF